MKTRTVLSAICLLALFGSLFMWVQTKNQEYIGIAIFAGVAAFFITQIEEN